MGCWHSRHDETGLITLCRRRRELIREAVDHRYSLAAAHASYFRTLAAVGDALLRYAREGIPPAQAREKENDAHVVMLPTSRKSADADGSGESSATPLSHSLSDEGSHLHLSSDDSAGVGGGKEGGQRPRLSPKYNYMRSSPASPNTVYYGDPFGGSYGYSGGYFNDSNYYYGRSVSPPVPARASSPPAPPPQPSSQGFAWDFFNPFYSYEQFLPGYSSGQYGMTSMGSSPSSTEVRAREGIPDLEDEMEPEPFMKVKKDNMVGNIPSLSEVKMQEGISGLGHGIEPESHTMKKGKMVAENIEAKDSGVRSSNNVQEKEIRELEKESMSSSGEKGSKVSSAKKGVSFQKGSSLAGERTGASDEGLLSVDGTRDVVEALGDIREEFKSALICSEEVSKLLEAGKRPYRPRNRLFKAISSRILVLAGFRMFSRRLFKHRRHLLARTIKSRSTNVELKQHVSLKAGLLSSTLEKLHLWEKKLYEEVKAEERLRAIYEKKCRRLQSLDDRGAEPQKINAVQVSIRSVRTKMSIAVTYVDFISRRMRSIMDQELQPQLANLIQGLIRMWKLLVGFHQKQLNAIIASQNYKLSIGTAFQDSVRKATMDLELLLLKWYASFDKWISAHKAFINALNGWLLKWFPEDHEATPDGIAPFSPSRIGAPPVFILTNDWSNAINSLSESEVKAAIHSFAANIHKLWECQDEEHKLHQKANSLSQVYSARFINLQKGQGDRDISVYDDMHDTALNTMKKRLDEVKSRHGEALRHVQAVTSVSLTTGLIPIFQTLTSFTSNILQACEAVRIPNKASGS